MTVIVQTRQSRYKHSSPDCPDICTYEIFGEKSLVNKLKEPVDFILKQNSIFNDDCLNIYRHKLIKLKKHINNIDEQLDEIKEGNRFYWADKAGRKEYSQLKADRKQTMKDIIFLDTHINELKEDMSKIGESGDNVNAFFEKMGFERKSSMVEDAKNRIDTNYEYLKDINTLIENINKEYIKAADSYANKFKRFLRGEKDFDTYIDTDTLDKITKKNNDRINNPITLEKNEKEIN